MAERDFLDKMVTKRTARNSAFSKAGRGATRRELVRTLEERREQQNQTQTAGAAAVATSQSFVARLESTAADARVSTVQRYAQESRVRGAVSPRSLRPERRRADHRRS